MSYFKKTLSDGAAEHCAHEARKVFNDIVYMTLSPVTKRSERMQCLRSVAEVLITETAAVRQTQMLDLNAEIAHSADLLSMLQEEYTAIEKDSKHDALTLAEMHGSGPENANMFLDFDEISGVHFDDDKPQYSRAPSSNRASPLLHTSPEEIHVPLRPHSVHFHIHRRAQSMQGSVHAPNLAKNFPVSPPTSPEEASLSSSQHTTNNNHSGRVGYVTSKEVVMDRARYRRELKRRVGAAKHRVFALQQLQRAFDHEEQEKMSDEDIQLAFLYALYSSREVRTFVCKRKVQLRSQLCLPMHKDKRYRFMIGLNKLTEDYHNEVISAATYIASLRHLHIFNFTPIWDEQTAQRALSRSASWSSQSESTPPSLNISGHSRRASEMDFDLNLTEDESSCVTEKPTASEIERQPNIASPMPKKLRKQAPSVILTSSSEVKGEKK